jgi:hypothetical protein
MNLMTELPKIAMRVLKNSHMVPKQLQPKMDVLKAVYSTAWVTRDFEAWCRDHIDDHFKYPITEYLHVIDERYAGIPEEKQPDMAHPDLIELSTLAYDLTGFLAPRKALAALLIDYPSEEIKTALREYVGLQGEKELKSAMRAFYSEGGAAAVILARRKRIEHGR